MIGVATGNGGGDPQEHAGTALGVGHARGGTNLQPMLLDDGQGKLDAAATNDERSTSDMDISMGSDADTERGAAAWELLQPPTLEATGEGVTGLTTEKLRRQNKRTRLRQLGEQQEYSQWQRHQGEIFISEHEWEERERQETSGKQMYPRGRACAHPAGPQLEEWATYGCPTCTGKNWTLEQMQAAIDWGPHQSALVPAALEHFKLEIEEKVRLGQAKLVEWNTIRNNPPPQLKISPVAAIPHNSKPYRSILDLSFRLRLQDGSSIPAVNDSTIKTAPQGACDQIGHALKRLIHAFAEAGDDEKRKGVHGEMGYKRWVLAVGLSTGRGM